jgi:hypothetical protein
MREGRSLLHWCRNAFRSSRWLLFAGIVAVSTAAVKAENCDLIRVVLSGCESVTLPPAIRVRIARGEVVTLNRQPDGSYTGTTSPIGPNDARKTAAVLDLQTVRTACDVTPKSDPTMTSLVTCRVLYEVPCEPFWAVDVTAKDTGLSLAYACKPRPPQISACDSDITDDDQASLDPESALTIAPMAISQHLLLDLRIAGEKDPLKYDLAPAVLQRQPGKTMKLSKLRPIGGATGVHDPNSNHDALMDAKSDAAKGVTITLKSVQ